MDYLVNGTIEAVRASDWNLGRFTDPAYGSFPNVAMSPATLALLRDGWWTRPPCVLPDPLPTGFQVGTGTTSGFGAGFNFSQFMQFYRFSDWTATGNGSPLTLTQPPVTPRPLLRFADFVQQQPPFGFAGAAGDYSVDFFIGATQFIAGFATQANGPFVFQDLIWPSLQIDVGGAGWSACNIPIVVGGGTTPAGTATICGVTVPLFTDSGAPTLAVRIEPGTPLLY